MKDICGGEVDKLIKHLLPHLFWFELLPFLMVHPTHAARVHLVFAHRLKALVPLSAQLRCLLELALSVFNLLVLKLL